MSHQPEYQYDVFLSFADADRPWVEGYLLPALTSVRDKGPPSIRYARGYHTPRFCRRSPAMRVLERFCHSDTFCNAFLPLWKRELPTHGERMRRRSGQLAMSEIMTILVYFHQMRFRDFKT